MSEITSHFNNALDGMVVDSNKHWRTLVREFGERQISMHDLENFSVSPKARGLAEMIGQDLLSLSELVVLGQYAKAINDADTKAATFLRDTAGYKPATDVTIDNKHNSLSNLSDDQLQLLLTKFEIIEGEN